jgi:hypothetical protein
VNQHICATDPMTEATRRVVAELNRARGLTFALHSRCPAGLQDGAWRLTDQHGRPAILTWRPDGSAAQAVHRARTVARLPAAGDPTPAWSAAGATSDGRAYSVVERDRDDSEVDPPGAPNGTAEPADWRELS